MYQQLGEEEKSDVTEIKKAVRIAFTTNSVAYEQFIACHLCPRVFVDAYLADLQKLALLFGGISEQGLTCAFVVGLPNHVIFFTWFSRSTTKHKL